MERHFVFWIGGNNIVKMSIQAKEIYRFNAIPAKNTHGIFHRTRTIEQIILKFIWNNKKPQIASDLEKKEKHGGIILPDSDYATKLQ